MNFMASRRGFYEDNSKGWTENNEEQEDENGLRCYLGGASAASDQPEMMMDSSSPTGGGGGGGGEESSDGLPPGGGIGLGLGRNSGNNEVQVIEREHMFDKVVTPSDVGKLNRLVIPKQHAERYFPLDSSTNEKGLLLNFEDRNGKPWRFRYSYWNSSQSYVMTKGWSRFVKEKKLDAGDIVSFQRGVGELGKDRLFIDWRRRPDAPELLPPPTIPGFSFSNHFSFRQGNYNHNPPHPYLLPPQQQRQLQFLQQTNPQSQINHHGYAYGSNSNLYGSGSVFYLKSPSTGGQPPPPPPYQQVGMVQMRGGGGSGGGGNGSGGGGYGVEGMPIHHHHHHHHPMVFESVPVVQGKAAAKRLRLFGVNMECPISESDECDILSSTTVPQTSHLSSSSFPSQLPLRSYNNGEDNVINKGKSSMSLDLDI